VPSGYVPTLDRLAEAALMLEYEMLFILPSRSFLKKSHCRDPYFAFPFSVLPSFSVNTLPSIVLALPSAPASRVKKKTKSLAGTVNPEGSPRFFSVTPRPSPGEEGPSPKG
jgi:hypothetical protein